MHSCIVYPLCVCVCVCVCVSAQPTCARLCWARHVHAARTQALLCLSSAAADEVHFSVGDALVEAVAGGAPGTAAGGTVNEPLLEHVLTHTLSVTLVSFRAAERSAAAVWLLALVRAVGGAAGVGARAADIHAAFARLLGEKSQLAQECAAKVCLCVCVCMPSVRVSCVSRAVRCM
jgi:hypothetical protein